MDLLLQELLQSNGVSSKLGDTFPQLLRRHRVLVQLEPEQRLVLQVRPLGDVQRGRLLALQLLGHCRVGVVQVLQQVGRDGQVVTPGQLGDLARVPERSTHDDGLVAMLLIVVEDALHRLDTGVLLGAILLLVRRLEPVQDPADERRDQKGAGLGTRDGLDEREHQSQVDVDVVLGLEDMGGLDTLPGGGDLDQDPVPGDTLLFVEL